MIKFYSNISYNICSFYNQESSIIEVCLDTSASQGIGIFEKRVDKVVKMLWDHYVKKNVIFYSNNCN